MAGRSQSAPQDAAALAPLSVWELLNMRASAFDRILMGIGTLAALVCGCVQPAVMLNLAPALDSLFGQGADQQLQNDVPTYTLRMVYLSLVAFASGFILIVTWNWTGERRTLSIQCAYAEALLHKPCQYYDLHPSTAVGVKFTRHMLVIRQALSSSVAEIARCLSNLIAGIVVAFMLNARLASIFVFSAVPLILVTAGLMARMNASLESKKTHSYEKAGRVATSAFFGIRTVAATCTEAYELNAYEDHTYKAQGAGVRVAFLTGIGSAGFFSAIFIGDMIACAWAARTVKDELESGCSSGCLTGGEVLALILATVVSTLGLGLIAPNVARLKEAQTAAASISAILLAHGDAVEATEETSAGNCGNGLSHPHTSTRADTERLGDVKGEIELRDVSFSFPTRQEERVLKSISLVIAPGESLGFVGESGSGKSTIAKLILRLYDPCQGSVHLDGVDVRELDAQWYRDQIGFVGQEPVLFSATIRENIAMGRPGATMDEITAAAKDSNAHDFIMSFTEGYDTMCGDGGGQLSGGQKQRIAIARAMLKNPPILVLDEATSALESSSQLAVLASLTAMRAQRARTTVSIAHRLSAVRNCSRIVLISEGDIAEVGSHDELLELGGAYAELFHKQQAGGGLAHGAEKDPSIAHLIGKVSHDESCSDDSGNVTDDMDARRVPPPHISSHISSKSEEGVMKRLYSLNRKQWVFFGTGFAGSFVAGLLFPALGVLLGLMVDGLYSSDPDEIASSWKEVRVGFIVLILVTWIACPLKSGCSGIYGENMVRTLRNISFRALLRGSVAWFDDPQYSSPGEAAYELEQSSQYASSAFALAPADVCQILVATLSGMILSLIFSWKFGLVACACVPLVSFGAVVRFAASGEKNTSAMKIQERASNLLLMALRHMTTVQAFNLQGVISKQYRAIVKGNKAALLRGVLAQALVYGIAFSIIFLVWAILLTAGEAQVDSGTSTPREVTISMLAILFGAASVGLIHSHLQYIGEGKAAAARLFAIIDEDVPIDPLCELGAEPTSIEGSLSFRHVSFSYPSRPDTIVLRDISLDIAAGSFVGIIGPSGSGKSTILDLVLRFYDTPSFGGAVALDGRDIKDIRVHWLRSQIGYVQQEPVLFYDTIRENIRRGKLDATEEEIIAAARSTHCHDFIMSLPHGYATHAGESGAQLSGGQKQRIAMAREVISKPSILVLDEATSALDLQSEKSVLASLQHLRSHSKMTVIVVAHRLTTVIDADIVHVVDRGRLVLSGTPSDLFSESQPESSSSASSMLARVGMYPSFRV
jgi:ATP-binding cassette subfamily B (MDR/TAP) protein 1